MGVVLCMETRTLPKHPRVGRLVPSLRGGTTTTTKNGRNGPIQLRFPGVGWESCWPGVWAAKQTSDGDPHPMLPLALK